ncbi:MAG: aldo/keto reductase [Phycisphaerales bacterium]|nr:aldo/keto reductase [Phycisphaerales bacterium]
MTFAADRYDSMVYRRCGRSGLRLPAISLGAWETFGGYRGEEVARACLHRAFDLGITHFDFANNYGTPPGNAEIVCGKIIREMPRDELIISSKAGFLMWPGPYGEWGSRKNLIASCDQSLRRMGVDYFDIFYSHRPDPDTPLEETLGALESLVKQGKALYAGVSNYNGAQYADSVHVVKQHDWSPITIHQPYYNMLNRQMERELLPLAERFGTGIIAFCPLASGLLSDKYLSDAIPAESRVARKWGKEWLEQNLTPRRRQSLIELNKIAQSRGQTLAQMALAWVLRLPGITSALIGASSVKQIEENVAALRNLSFSDEQLQRIDHLAPIG